MKDKKLINLVLFQPEIPQNTGAIIRLCSCLSVPMEIIEPCGFIMGDKRIKRVAMDYKMKNEIIRHKSWEALAKAGKTSYSFRHGYALRCHQQYGLSVRIAAALMGHSTDTHTRIYGTWTDEDEIDKALERGQRYKEMTKEAL